jgi:anaerobic selenocysteine-containing dehydrogenase
LQLLTPKSHYFLNSTFANMARNQKSQGVPTLTINPHDAEARSLSGGERVSVRRDGVKVDVMLAVSDAVREGVAALEGKWWDEDRPDAAPLNRLTPSRWSPKGQPAYNDTWVTVEQAG